VQKLILFIKWVGEIMRRIQYLSGFIIINEEISEQANRQPDSLNAR
jgi:hypothetical protein